MKDKKTFGSFIKEKRINKNYSQKDLAELLYVTESAVSKWERGVTYPDITLITDICRVLEVSEKELIQCSDDNEYRKIKRDSDKYNKLKKVLFWIFNICYSTAILTCLIVNLAVNHTLSWFFIVLSSIIVAYTFCPTITWVYDKFKMLIFVGSTFISLFLLFLTCSIYFNDYWFMIPTMGLLLGYFIIFYPMLFTSQKKYLDKDKYKKLSKWFLLSYSIGILILILLLLISIYCYNPFNLGLGFIITCGTMSLLIIFGIIKTLNIGDNIIKMISISIISLIVVGILFSFGRAIYLKSFEETNTYIIEETFNNVNINVQTDKINIYLSEENKIEYTENKNITIETKVINDTLMIERIDNRKFYDQIFNFTSFKLDLYLSKDSIDLLNIDNSTGDITINQGFTINSVNIDNSTGDTEIKSNVTNNLFIENSTGDIKIDNCKNTGNINIKTDTGDVYLLNVNCKKLDINIDTGDTKLINTLIENDFNMKGSTGKLYLDEFDALNIYVKLSTGDVKGTILSSKFFIANSDTGIVKVPETREGGECRITVDTGNIIIQYK